ncbi:DUF72 domain-containing protein [Candidatus Bathyarchaeota archaeon]|nr:MAG: DUF72 domain-containing protein [Candidatus Bathyarchaeota archaeon]
MIKIGCCGYPVGRKRYQETFRLVEINRTFYNIPKIETLIKWRRDAPAEFEFTVKAHQDLSHKYKLKLEDSLKVFEAMKLICRSLEARILLIQTPASFKPDQLEVAEAFFKGIRREELLVVWETRGPSWETSETRERLKELLESLDVPHVTDPFRSLPVYSGSVAYLRLHGSGSRMYYYQYSDEELLKLQRIVKSLEAGGREVYVLFNNLSMFEDASRFLSFIETGRFPPLTLRGTDSIRNLLRRMRYPSTKSVIMKKIGWRLIELEEHKQVRLEEILRNLPSKTYKSAEEILKELNL